MEKLLPEMASQGSRLSGNDRDLGLEIGKGLGLRSRLKSENGTIGRDMDLDLEWDLGL